LHKLDYKVGHLPEAINEWYDKGIKLIASNFKQVTTNNYELVSKDNI